MLNTNLSLKEMQIVGTGKTNFIAKETSFYCFNQRLEIEWLVLVKTTLLKKPLSTVLARDERSNSTHAPSWSPDKRLEDGFFFFEIFKWFV